MNHNYKAGAPIICRDIYGDDLLWCQVVSRTDKLGLYKVKHLHKDIPFSFDYSFVASHWVKGLHEQVIKAWYDKKKNDTKP